MISYGATVAEQDRVLFCVIMFCYCRQLTICDAVIPAFCYKSKAFTGQKSYP